MIKLFTDIQFNNTKSTALLPCKCEQCGSTFYKVKKEITYELKHKRNAIRFCSTTCQKESLKSKLHEINCQLCEKIIKKTLYRLNKTKKHFCSHSCHATYINTNKTTGYKRSKLEVWIEEQLTILYPNLEIHYNRTSTINSELDIYIPSLNLAFELNGIFHYEPIYGIPTLNKIKNNDISKTKACHDAKINLCIIDTSNQKKFTESSSTIFLNIINNIIKECLSTI